MSSTPRRDFLKTLAAAVPASAALPAYQAMAAPLRKKVKITDVKVMVVQGTAPWNMVKIETDGGVTGIGEAYWGRGVKDVILGYLRSLAVGEDPLNIEPLYSKMVLSTSGAGSLAGVTVTAISGVEIALWDLAGKLLGVPVYTLLGGKYRDGVRAYWTGQPEDILSPASCREFASMVKNSPLGITAVKPAFYSIPALPTPWHPSSDHLYGIPTTHLTRQALSQITRGYENLRAALGEEIDIAVHCHWEYDLIDALELARAVAPIKPMWLEDPMPPAYSESWSKLTQESPVPILTGENLYKREGFAPFILNQGCHMVQIDIPKAGGLLESKKIADMAALYYLPICSHNASSPVGTIASAHAAASMRDFRAQEFSPGTLKPEEYEKAVIYDGPVIQDGKWRILDKPGLGVELNEDYVRAHLLPGEEWWG
ncbi:MAG TPA: mandelate racemase/muconate lactonizing enzyme family protein [Terriglobia bacterium]|nr:mandelate racemase/muconate lactonizing enzyme family protein [Terriglobia bacterium]